MADVVLNMRDGRPIWAIPPGAVEELRGALPPGWSLFVAPGPADGSGDGAGTPPAEVLEAVRGARVYLGFGVPSAVLEAAGPSLRWVHSGAAGVGSSLEAIRSAPEVRFTNSAGIHGPPIAETVLGMLLHFARGLDYAIEGKGRGAWDPGPFLAADTPVCELGEMTVGILGYGGIGREIGRRLAPLGTRVLGFRRSAGAGGRVGDSVDPGKAVDSGDSVDPGPKIEPAVLLHGPSGLERLLAESDALVLAAPLTPETRGILGAERIRSLRRGAIVVNIARGALVDEEALVDALRDGHLRGAGLDVFATEPLPPESPLWRLPNVLVTPHVSAVTRQFWRREMDLVIDNLRRHLAGLPLRNEVQPDRGY